jgi:hypothetical protein
VSSSLLLLVIKVLDLLPSELVSAEVASGSSVLVDGLFEVEVLNEHSRTQVEVVEDDPLQISISIS